MALITLSGLVSGIKGKLNGSYFQTKKNSTSINNINPRRSKAKATQGSLVQAQQRLGFVSRLYRTISNSQRNEWAAFAATLTRVNKNGVTYTPTAYQIFTECNNNHMLIDGSTMSTPATPAEPQDILPITSAIDIEGDLVIQHPAGIDTGKVLLVYTSAPCSQGVNYPQTGYRLTKQISTTALAETIITTEYKALWRPFNTGERIFVKLALVDATAFIQEGAKLTKADAG